MFAGDWGQMCGEGGEVKVVQVDEDAVLIVFNL